MLSPVEVLAVCNGLLVGIQSTSNVLFISLAWFHSANMQIYSTCSQAKNVNSAGFEPGPKIIKDRRLATQVFSACF